MSQPTIELEHRTAITVSDRTADAVLERLDFAITGPSVETFKMDIVACSSSSSSSSGTAQRRPK